MECNHSCVKHCRPRPLTQEEIDESVKTFEAIYDSVAEATKRTLVRRGVCTCGEVDKENTLGHADGCKYFSNSVYEYSK